LGRAPLATMEAYLEAFELVILGGAQK
jgi:hypothetical protein